MVVWALVGAGAPRRTPQWSIIVWFEPTLLSKPSSGKLEGTALLLCVTAAPAAVVGLSSQHHGEDARAAKVTHVKHHAPPALRAARAPAASRAPLAATDVLSMAQLRARFEAKPRCESALQCAYDPLPRSFRGRSLRVHVEPEMFDPRLATGHAQAPAPHSLRHDKNGEWSPLGPAYSISS